MIEFYLDEKNNKCNFKCDAVDYSNMLAANIGFICGTYKSILDQHPELAERFRTEMQLLMDDNSFIWSKNYLICGGNKNVK